MRANGLLLCLLALFAIFSLAQGCSKYYTVVSGDLCYTIATRFNIDVNTLESLNPGLNCYSLQIGQVLCVAGGGPPPPPPPPGPPPPSGSPSFSQFSNAITQSNYPQPTQDQYNSFIAGYQSAGQISSTRELAMFLAEILWESGGLQYKRELACITNNCTTSYRSAGDPDGVYYYGRGYIQLSWSYNYKAASQALLGDQNTLFYSPDSVASQESLSWNTAYWFWATNVHSDPGVQAGQFGSATNKINGGLECNPCRGACTNRFNIYSIVLKAFGDNEAPNSAGC